MCCTSDILLGVLAIIFPPIAVWIKSGLCTIDSLINILLCMLGYIPGLLHAWYIIAKYPEENENTYERAYGGDLENRHVTYYYVNDSRNNSNAGLPAPQQQLYPNPNRGYGTVQGMSPQPQPQPQPQQPPSQAKPQQGYQQQQGQRQGGGSGGEGSSQVPPSYEQAVAGDNKVQS